jgi:hypothetical protein
MPITSSSLQTFWDNVASHHYHRNVQDEATAEQVREFMMEYLDGEPHSDPSVHRFWNPLSEVQKEHALATAFPDGEIYRRKA